MIISIYTYIFMNLQTDISKNSLLKMLIKNLRNILDWFNFNERYVQYFKLIHFTTKIIIEKKIPMCLILL